MFGSIKFLAHRIPPSVAIRLRNKIPPVILPYLVALTKSPEDDLARLLYGGYSSVALNGLAKIATKGNLKESIRAHWWLGRWKLGNGNFADALDHFRMIPSDAGADTLSKRIAELECYRLLGELRKAWDFANLTDVKHRKSEEFILSQANIIQNTPLKSSEEWLACINKIFSNAGLLNLSYIDPKISLNLGNITTEQIKCNTKHTTPLISVLMPVYKPRSEISYAIRGLLQQTWKNIEIIVIDDGSGDEYIGKFQHIESIDNRIKVIYQKQNTGAYSARNTGLNYCSGRYVTTHDADDWSHPQKLELQVLRHLSNSNVRVSSTSMVRCSEDLVFSLPKHPNASRIRMNYSSAMYARNDLIKSGGWDNVRISADSELIRRFSAIYGKDCVANIQPNVPMSFALETGLSLTGASKTSLDTVYHGVRKEYLEAAKLSHENIHDYPVVPQKNRARRFPVPEFILPDRRNLELDIALILDAQKSIDSYPLLTTAILSSTRLRVGVFHWQEFHKGTAPKPNEINGSFRVAADIGKLKIICPGELVQTNVLIGEKVGIFRNPIDIPPKFDTTRFFIGKREDPWGEDILYTDLVTDRPPEFLDTIELSGIIKSLDGT
ncbi:glycosyltransferase family 2 protein [Sulfitobacter sp. R18_2]|uniref:glycosyltransferase family 2 protein n=1 Tax=Sulfitobacter sp. R18_2 TaxID=2821105 RepID=UPI001ADC85B1|nr:glycosyltransferase family A protein [Sulfitobacter sp. R18_2]MBO9440137.1 glycosyltransferase family 2 protein [Sulfitobacter sp. R18_2]